MYLRKGPLEHVVDEDSYERNCDQVETNVIERGRTFQFYFTNEYETNECYLAFGVTKKIA